MREAFHAVLSKSQMMKFEVYERMKLKILHENLIKDETVPSIIEIIKTILTDLNEVFLSYKTQ